MSNYDQALRDLRIALSKGNFNTYAPHNSNYSYYDFDCQYTTIQYTKINYLIHRVQVSFYELNTTQNPHFVEELIYKRLAMLMNLLPDGTQFVGIHESPATAMYKEVLLELKHPFFPSGTEIILDLQNALWKVDGKVKQSEMCTGIRFVDPEGKLIDLVNQVIKNSIGL